MSGDKSARPVGRPRDPTKADAIVAAGWDLFLARGVEAVPIDTIAEAAGVSKGTLYSHFSDKAQIFEAGVRREMERIEAAQRRGGSTQEASLETILNDFGIGIMHFLASKSAVDFYSSLAGELRRKPRLAKAFYDAGPGKTLSNLAAILSSPIAGELAIDDAESAAETLFGMWQGFSNFRLSLGVGKSSSTRNIEQSVKRATARFLRAYAR